MVYFPPKFDDDKDKYANFFGKLKDLIKLKED